MARIGHTPPAGLFSRTPQLAFATASTGALGWIAFVGSVHLHEMLVGAVILALTTIFATAVFRSESLPFDLRWKDVVQGWRIPWYILSGCGEIVMLLLKDLFGTPAESLYRVCGFRGGMRDPLAVERITLAIAYTTTAPNFIVIGIDPHQNHMLFHQLQRSDVPRMTKNLGAQA